MAADSGLELQTGPHELQVGVHDLGLGLGEAHIEEGVSEDDVDLFVGHCTQSLVSGHGQWVSHS